MGKFTLFTLLGVKTFIDEIVAYAYLGEIMVNTELYNNATSHNLTTSFYGDGVMLHGGMSMVNDSGKTLVSGQALFTGTDVFLRRGILSVS